MAPRTPRIDNSGATGPFPASTFLVSNSWQGPVGNRWLIVFAGSAAGHPALRAYSTNADPGGSGFMDLLGEYPAPAPRRGATLRILAERRGVLTLNDAHAFDTRRMKFIPPSHPPP